MSKVLDVVMLFSKYTGAKSPRLILWFYVVNEGGERERERAMTFESVYQAAPSAHAPSAHADVASTAAAPSSVHKVREERECVCMCV